MLKDKKILFITVSFFNYEKIIRDKLLERGAHVDFFDERPSNSVFIKGLLRIKRDLIKNQIEKYYKLILKQIQGKKYDYFLLIKGEVIPVFFIKKLKELNPNMVLLYYNFDSFENNPHALDFIPYFDKTYTFDSSDAKKYNMDFRPLFFSDDYKELGNSGVNVSKYNVAFIGTAHSDRYTISQSVAEQTKKYSLSSFEYYYSQGKFVYLYKKFFDKSFKHFDYNKLSFKSLSHKEIINIYSNTSCILDINHPNQKGLTMRTFETLGAGKKLITTNDDITNYNIYKSGNILVIDRNSPIINKDFLTKEASEIDQKTLYQMSLDGWIDDVFMISSSDYKWFC